MSDKFGAGPIREGWGYQVVNYNYVDVPILWLFQVVRYWDDKNSTYLYLNLCININLHW